MYEKLFIKNYQNESNTGVHLGNECWFSAPQRWCHHAFHLDMVTFCSQRVACKKQLNFCLIDKVNVCVDKKQNKKTKTRIDGGEKSWTANYWSALSFVPSHESSPTVFSQKSWAGFLVVKEIGEDFKTPRGAGRKKSIIYCLLCFYGSNYTCKKWMSAHRITHTCLYPSWTVDSCSSNWIARSLNSVDGGWLS